MARCPATRRRSGSRTWPIRSYSGTRLSIRLNTLSISETSTTWPPPWPVLTRSNDINAPITPCSEARRIADADADAGGRTVRIAGREAHAAHRFADRAEAGAVAIRAGLAVAGYAHHRQFRIDRATARPSRGRAFRARRAGNSRSRRRRLAARSRAIVDGLPATSDSIAIDFLLRDCRYHQSEVPSCSLRHLRKGIAAAGRFDLDDFGAELGEQPRSKWRGDQRAQFDDANSA